MLDPRKVTGNYELPEFKTPQQEAVATRLSSVQWSVYNVRISAERMDPTISQAIEKPVADKPLVDSRESDLSVPASVAGAVLAEEVVERPTVPEGEGLFDEDPIHAMNQEMFMQDASTEAAREQVRLAYENNEDLTNA
jgi:hypothetical protein